MSTTLSDFLQTTRDTREYQRALAVQMALNGLDYATITTQLSVSPAFISKGKGIYLDHGVEALRMGYHGSKGYLTKEQREQTIAWLREQHTWSVLSLKELGLSLECMAMVWYTLPYARGIG